MELTFKPRKHRPYIFRAGSYEIAGYLYRWENGNLIPCERHWGAFHIMKNRQSSYVERGVKSYETFEQAADACNKHYGRAKCTT